MTQIPDKFVLPCDFKVGPMTFGKGVTLETVRLAAERWFAAAQKEWTPDPGKIEQLRRMMAIPNGE